MAICKCHVRPRQGEFEVGKYYIWYYAVTETQLKPKSVRDADKENFRLSIRKEGKRQGSFRNEPAPALVKQNRYKMSGK